VPPECDQGVVRTFTRDPGGFGQRPLGRVTSFSKLLGRQKIRKEGKSMCGELCRAIEHQLMPGLRHDNPILIS
jgi:hypothetical protein